MRAVYRNPKELVSAVKDLVDQYLDSLMTYEKLADKITKISEANPDRFFKNNKIDGNIVNVLGEERLEVINKILSEK